MPRLKVYRTAIGFHDAYVAAPSQKAALAAWGVDKNLFARGAAEVVTDPALIKQALARPGEVVRRSRGSLDEQLKALRPTFRRKRKDAGPSEAPKPRPDKPQRARETRKPTPPPSRAEVTQAEAALASDAVAARTEREALRKRERALAREREKLEQAQRNRTARLTERLERARERYRIAFERWTERQAE